MTPRIHELPCAVICWTQEGCPACESYLPKFLAVAEKYKQCLPVLVVDVNLAPGAADAFGVQGTPLTVISRWGKRSFRFIDGDSSEQLIENLFFQATRGLDCPVV